MKIAHVAVLFVDSPTKVVVVQVENLCMVSLELETRSVCLLRTQIDQGGQRSRKSSGEVVLVQ